MTRLGQRTGDHGRTDRWVERRVTPARLRSQPPGDTSANRYRPESLLLHPVRVPNADGLRSVPESLSSSDDPFLLVVPAAELAKVAAAATAGRRPRTGGWGPNFLWLTGPVRRRFREHRPDARGGGARFGRAGRWPPSRETMGCTSGLRAWAADRVPRPAGRPVPGVGLLVTPWASPPRPPSTASRRCPGRPSDSGQESRSRKASYSAVPCWAW